MAMLFDGPPFNAGGHGVNQTSGYGCWSPMQIREGLWNLVQGKASK